MHLRRTSWIALPLIVSLSLGGLVPSARATGDSKRVLRSHAPPPARQSGKILPLLAAAVFSTALLGAAVGKYFPLANEGKGAGVMPSVCRVAYAEDKTAVVGTWRRGPVALSLPSFGYVLSHGTETGTGVDVKGWGAAGLWKPAEKARYFEVNKVDDVKGLDQCPSAERSHIADIALAIGASARGARLAPK